MIPWMGKNYKCYFEKSICQNIPKHSVIAEEIIYIC